MKRFRKLARAVHVESQVLSAVFIGYFVLLVASVMLITKSANQSESNSMTATKDVRTSHQLTN